MTQKTIPFIEGKFGWNYGESGWNSGMDENLVKFSFLFDRNIDAVVSSLPPPSEGSAYFNTTDNRLYFCTQGVFYSSPIPLNFQINLKTTDQTFLWNGTSLEEVSGPSDIDTRLEALESNTSGLGSAAYQDSSYFAIAQDLLNTTDVTKNSSLIGWKERTLNLKFNDWVNVKDLGGIGDGTYHALSEKFASLAQAQVKYPFVTSLTQSIDWAACQKALNLGGRVDFSGNPNNYIISDVLSVTQSSTLINFAGCTISAAAGFTADTMLSLPANDISIVGGLTMDAGNMPPVTANFDPNQLKGFAIVQQGSAISEFTGLSISGGRVYIKNSPAAAIGVQYGADFNIENVYALNCDNSTTYIGPGVLYFNRCHNYTLSNLKCKNFKWKGLYNSNATDFSVNSAFCENGVSDQAAIFFVTSSSFEATQLQTRNAFGVKFDKCTDFTTDGILARCNNVGLLGVFLQGCIGYTLSRIFITDYVTSGLEVSYHPGPPASNALVGTISGFMIRNGGGSSTSAIRVFGSSTETFGQLRLNSGYIYSCTRGIQVLNDGTSVDNRRLSIEGVTVDTFTTCGIEGVAKEHSIKSVEFYNPGSSAEACINVFQRAGQTCNFVSITNCSAEGLSSSTPFVACLPTSTRLFTVGDLILVGNNVRGGSRLLNLAMSQAGNSLASLQISSNTHNGSATTTSIGISNSTGSGVTQVAIVSNILLTSALAKANINFVEAAATGRFNGVVENNTSGVVNKPNNI